MVRMLCQSPGSTNGVLGSKTDVQVWKMNPGLAARQRQQKWGKRCLGGWAHQIWQVSKDQGSGLEIWHFGIPICQQFHRQCFLECLDEFEMDSFLLYTKTHNSSYLQQLWPVFDGSRHLGIHVIHWCFQLWGWNVARGKTIEWYYRLQNENIWFRSKVIIILSLLFGQPSY